MSNGTKQQTHQHEAVFDEIRDILQKIDSDLAAGTLTATISDAAVQKIADAMRPSPPPPAPPPAVTPLEAFIAITRGPDVHK